MTGLVYPFVGLHDPGRHWRGMGGGHLSSPNDVLSIEALLASLGFRSHGAQAAARKVLVSAGLSTPRKTNIAAYKREQVENELATHLVRVCESTGCEAKARRDRRERVTVHIADCEMCGGGSTRHATNIMLERLSAAGVRRILVVGGSPTVHTQLNTLFEESRIEIDIVPGDRMLDARRAEALANRADVIVVWGASILSHKVSTFFTDPRFGHKRAMLARRGVRSFAEAVTRHLELARR